MTVSIDGVEHTVDVWSDESALRVLQGLLGRPRIPSRCEQGLCGTCECVVDGQPARLCLLPAPRLDGRVIVTPPSWHEPPSPPTPPPPSPPPDGRSGPGRWAASA